MRRKISIYDFIDDSWLSKYFTNKTSFRKKVFFFLFSNCPWNFPWTQKKIKSEWKIIFEKRRRNCKNKKECVALRNGARSLEFAIVTIHEFLRIFYRLRRTCRKEVKKTFSFISEEERQFLRPASHHARQTQNFLLYSNQKKIPCDDSMMEFCNPALFLELYDA